MPDPTPTRRQFLRTASLTAFAVAAAACGTSTPPPEPDRQVRQRDLTIGKRRADVIVIGAGAAGLAAAQKLVQNGRSVIVLEARDRVGGRMHTRTTVGVPVDMGASWIEGLTGNPVARLADELHVPQRRGGERLALYAAGRRLTPAATRAAERDAAARVADAQAWGEREPDADVPLARGLAATGNALGAWSPTERWFFRSNIEDEYAAGADALSLWYFDSDSVFPGDDAMLPHGYSQIAQLLATDLDVRLATEVTAIDHGPAGVEVHAGSVTFHGHHAVVTVPLPLLRSLPIRPALPERKRVAMQRLGMGLLNKVVLRFPRAAWPSDIAYLGLVGNPISPLAEWWNLAPLTGAPVLMALAGGEAGEWVESTDDATVVATAMRHLRAATGLDLGDPTAHDIMRWRGEPHTRGSYSYRGVGATMEDHAALGAVAPHDRLLIAGEATHRRYPSTVHGAVLSGRAQADRILAAWPVQP